MCDSMHTREELVDRKHCPCVFLPCPFLFWCFSTQATNEVCRMFLWVVCWDVWCNCVFVTSDCHLCLYCHISFNQADLPVRVLVFFAGRRAISACLWLSQAVLDCLGRAPLFCVQLSPAASACAIAVCGVSGCLSMWCVYIYFFYCLFVQNFAVSCDNSAFPNAAAMWYELYCEPHLHLLYPTQRPTPNFMKPVQCGPHDPTRARDCPELKSSTTNYCDQLQWSVCSFISGVFWHHLGRWHRF